MRADIVVGISFDFTLLFTLFLSDLSCFTPQQGIFLSLSPTASSLPPSFAVVPAAGTNCLSYVCNDLQVKVAPC